MTIVELHDEIFERLPRFMEATGIKRQKTALKEAQEQMNMRIEPMTNKEFWSILDNKNSDGDCLPSPNMHYIFRQMVDVMGEFETIDMDGWQDLADQLFGEGLLLLPLFEPC